MIPRYSRKEMSKIWGQKNKFQIWLEIEAYACDAQAALGNIPTQAAKDIWERGQFDIEKIDEIEKKTHHDVIAFLTNLADYVGPNSKFIHQGMTSSDVLDTCLSVQLTQATDLLLNDLKNLLYTIKKRSFEHKHTFCVGRSHGIHAEPTSFGLKLAQTYAEFSRNYERLLNARKEISTCAISGAVGTYANIDPRVEKYVAEKLGLEVEPISTQVIPRDRHAMFFATLGVIAASIDRIATEIRHLQRTEVLEVEEYFAKGQKGSSAMPHKRNPVLSENLSGLSRLIRGYTIPAFENVVLWHERDISHSSVERIAAPDATISLDFALNRLNEILKNLIVYPKKMLENLDKLGGLIHSQTILLALIEKGLSRENAYEIVQENALNVWKNGGSFLEVLSNDSRTMENFNKEELKKLFETEPHFKHIDTVFERVFGVDA